VHHVAPAESKAYCTTVDRLPIAPAQGCEHGATPSGRFTPCLGSDQIDTTTQAPEVKPATTELQHIEIARRPMIRRIEYK
jgi:hypothetical protein